MKKKLSYRDQLIELAQIYDVKEIKDYVRNRKNLTTGQLELILKKNKIVIPKEFKTNFFKENFIKPLSKASKRIEDFKEGSSRKASKVSRQIGYFKEDSSRAANRVSRKISYFKQDSSNAVVSFFYNLWKSSGNAGLAFLNIFPKSLSYHRHLLQLLDICHLSPCVHYRLRGTRTYFFFCISGM